EPAARSQSSWSSGTGCRKAASPENTASASRNSGKSRRRSIRRASSSIRSAGPSPCRPAVARSFIISTKTWSRWALWFTSTTKIHGSRPSRNSSASRRIQRSGVYSRAASACPMARAPSPRAGGSRCRSCPFPAGCCWGAQQGSSTSPASRDRTTR
ncbi:hypothetical protein KXX17_001717, partial [Aspergillus fumigatus]